MALMTTPGMPERSLAEAPFACSGIFWRAKRTFDVAISLLALPILASIALFLTMLNPLLNRGPLFFVQTRMGRGQVPFSMIKFRTMTPASEILRRADDPVERERITPLGYWLRRLRIDELPQIINVLRGDMSLIGPRPDYIEHARDYALTVPHYCERHVVRPGISGYAQVQLGYTEGFDRTGTKAMMDLYYIRNASWRLEAWIVLRTLGVILTGQGAR